MSRFSAIGQQIDLEDDSAVIRNLENFRNVFHSHTIGMSQENFLSRLNIIENMRTHLEAANAAMRGGLGGLKTKILSLDKDKVTTIAALTAVIALTALSLWMIWKEAKQDAMDRKKLTDRLDAALRHISKPGFKFTREAKGDELGRLYINGKPVSEIREELRKYTASNEEMTDTEKAQCIIAINKANDKVLRVLSDLRQQIVSFDKGIEQRNLQRQVDAIAARGNASPTYIHMSSESLSTKGYVGVGVVLFAIVSMLSWGAYRVLLWLTRKFS